LRLRRIKIKDNQLVIKGWRKGTIKEVDLLNDFGDFEGLSHYNFDRGLDNGTDDNNNTG